jgi:hypothetical protein
MSMRGLLAGSVTTLWMAIAHGCGVGEAANPVSEATANGTATLTIAPESITPHAVTVQAGQPLLFSNHDFISHALNTSAQDTSRPCFLPAVNAILPGAWVSVTLDESLRTCTISDSSHPGDPNFVVMLTVSAAR